MYFLSQKYRKKDAEFLHYAEFLHSANYIY